MRASLACLACLASLVSLAAGCKGSPDDTPWCTDDAPGAGDDGGAPASPTYYQDVQPILQAKCATCHQPGAIAPFALQTYQDAITYAGIVRGAVDQRLMPPWVAARCCTDYLHDWSLTPAEIATVDRWMDTGLPAGDAQHPVTASPAVGLSRVDATITMPQAYTPRARYGGSDDLRCFVLDPPAGGGFVTGMNPQPGVRTIVHHLIVEAIGGNSLAQAQALEGQDGSPGFDCSTWFGDPRDIVGLGGGLIGGDFPEGLGTPLPSGSKILLQVHYSLANAPAAPDQTSVQLKLDAHATPMKGIAIANIAWMVGDGMKIPAGEKDAVFWYRFDPLLFTGDKTVWLRSAEPHMHAFGTRFVLRAIHGDGSRECLLQVDDWRFGWEQPFWFAHPKKLEPGDQLYVECHFDNSASHQPNGQPPRDIAWGDNNQDMCAGFLSFTESAP